MHRAYGLLPNMSWVLDRGGAILYKAMWTSAARIGEFLDRRQEQPAGPASATFYAEHLEPLLRDRAAFQRGPACGHRVRAGGADLGRAGPRCPSVGVETSAYSVWAGSFGVGAAARSNRSETRLSTRIPCT